MSSILVVDDEKSIRITLKAFLEEAGYEVHAAEDASQAIQKLKAMDFDVVVTDIILPRTTGVDLLKAIRNDSPHSKVIMMTGEPTVETSAASLRFGAFDYLFKPIAKEEIMATVRNAVALKKLEDDKRAFEEEKRNYQAHLENLVQERTQALRDSEKRLQVILDSLPVGIVTIARDSHEIVDANSGAVKMIGAQKEQIVGANCYGFICPAEERSCPVTDLNQKIFNHESYLTSPDGVQTPVLTTVSFLSIDDKEYLLESFIDITERKRLEKQLRQLQKMEAIGTLASGIAHDFNNILSSIIGFSEFAIEKSEKGSTVYDCLDEVLIAGRRARDLVKQILTFSRQGDVELKPIEVSHIVKEVIKMLRSSLPSTIEIEQNVAGDLSIIGDPIQVHQILMNLTTNAAHAMEAESGVLGITAKSVRIGAPDAARYDDIEPGEYVHLAVRDNGCGMTPDVVSRIFDPFFTTKEKGEGTGMGLSVVHGIVKSHFGSVTVETRPGEGSTFHVMLPAIKKPVSNERYRDVSLARGTESILFVDDEPSIGKSCKQILESLGYRVMVRTNGMEALALFKADPRRFDLVITDMTMPKMTGEELAVSVMELRPEIPVVICTGFHKRMDEAAAQKMGIRAFISKPILRQELATTIRIVLDKACEKES